MKYNLKFSFVDKYIYLLFGKNLLNFLDGLIYNKANIASS